MEKEKPCKHAFPLHIQTVYLISHNPVNILCILPKLSVFFPSLINAVTLGIG